MKWLAKQRRKRRNRTERKSEASSDAIGDVDEGSCHTCLSSAIDSGTDADVAGARTADGTPGRRNVVKGSRLESLRNDGDSDGDSDSEQLRM